MAILTETIPHSSDLGDQPFYLRVAYLIATITVVGFAQLALRGISHPLSVPIWVHLHALTAASWLVLFLVQNHLAADGNFTFHRRLGWVGTLLALAIVVFGFITAIKALELHRVPPGFSPAYFLAVTMLQLVLFPVLVLAAILLRREMQSHRRLMFGALIVICGSPGITRMPPSNLMGGERGEWLVLLFELILLVVMMGHDRKIFGHIHRATVAVVCCIVVAQLGPTIAARMPAVKIIASRLQN